MVWKKSKHVDENRSKSVCRSYAEWDTKVASSKSSVKTLMILPVV